MSFIGYKNGQMHMEDVSLESIADVIGTPAYCYSTEQIAENFLNYKKALAAVMPEQKFTICYACKANSNQAILKELGRLGAGADVVSGGELYRAFKAGIGAHKIVFSGVGKSDAEIAKAVKNGILKINVESESELEAISRISDQEKKKTAIAFRINPDVDAKTHAKITTGKSENKFGIDIAHAPALYEKAKGMPGIDANGVAMHIGSQLTDIEPYAEAFKRLAKLVTELRKQGHKILTVDLGGGAGITYKDEKPLDLAKYAELVRDIIVPLDVHVIVEPGRSITGNAGVLLTRVLHVKHGQDKKFLIIDAAMNDLMRPSLYDAYHPILPCHEPAVGSKKVKFDVVGPVCESADTFLTDAEFPLLERGALLAVMVSGAYGAVMASNYNSRPLVPEVLVSDKQFDLIRKAQKIEDIVAMDIVPEWL